MIRWTLQRARMVFMILILISICSLNARSQAISLTNHSDQFAKAPPVVSATATPDSICDGEQSTLQATGNMGTPPYTYFWDHALGAGSTHIVTPSVTTTYYVTITDGLGFTDVDSVTVVVFDVPLPNISATPNPVCSGSACLLQSNPTGGSSPYAYDWDHGLGSGSSHTVFPTTDETYKLTVTDINGCTAISQVTVTVNDNPTATATVSSNDICDGETVTLTGSAVGGQPPYTTYSWDNGLGFGITHDVSPHDTTTYTLTVFDSNGCMDTAQVVVNVAPTPSVSATANPSPICANESTNLSATPVGGTSPYAYNWDNGLGGGSTHFVAPGDTTTYAVTVTDNNGCTATDSVTVDVWELPVPNATATPSVICEDQPSDLSVTTTGGESPYSYFWNHGLGVGADHTVYPSDDITYTVTVTDDNGCSATDLVSIVHHDQPTVTASATPDTVCAFEPVDLTATGSGTTGPYSYTWDNGVGGGQNHTVYPAGDITYTVTVYDGNGCSATAQVSVITRDLPDPNPTATPNPICDDDSSQLSAAGSGGVPPYTYTWDNGLGPGPIHIVSPGVSTTYTVTVTDANGCSSQGSVLLEIFDLPLIDLTADPNPICGANSSLITTTPTGGYPPFTFFWDHSIGYVQNPTVNPTSTTTYHLTVTDVNGCTTTDSITIDVFDAPSVTASATPNPICEGQSVTLSASGSDGLPPYTYEWDNGIGFGNPIVVTPTATTIYTVTITDANGCTADDQVLVGVYGKPDLTLTANPDSICEGGIVNLYASADNGYDPYTFEWDHGLGFGDHVIDTPAATTTYHATVTDNNGCQDSSEITVVVNENPLANISVIPSNPICEGDDATLIASGSGGVAPYSYEWDNGLGVGPSHTVSPTTTTTYCVTVTDDNGCQDDTCINLSVYPSPTVTASASDSTICPGESVDLSATGGGTVPSYIFIWDNGLGSGANHTVTPATTTTYTVIIQDGNGCTTSDDVTVQVINMPPANPTATPDSSCSGEDVILNITMTGGISPYDYAWDNGLDSVQTQIVNPFVTTTYTVTVQDATGCTVAGSVTVYVYDLPQTNLTASPNPICGTGNSTLYPNAFGGTSPYEYAWDNGLDSIENPVISPLATTEYHLTVIDNNGCTNTDSVTVNVYDIPDVTASANPVTICEGDSSVLTAAGSNGTPPYSFSWDNGAGSGSPVTVFPTISTVYTVTITDSNGCEATDTTLVNVHETPNLSLSATPSVICEGETSILQATVTGGAPISSYTWNPPLGGGSSHFVSPATSTLYEVTATDVYGCSSSDQAIITVNENPSVTLTATPNPLCYNGCSLLAANVVGGTPGYSYGWNNGLPPQPSHTICINTPDTYNVTVTDLHGCEGTASLFVDVYPEIIITTNVLTEPTCYGDSDASFDISVSGGSPNYDITWNNTTGPDNGSFLNSGGGPHVVNSVTGGNYTVSVIDANGCAAGHTFVLDQPDELVFTLNNTYPITCNGDNDGAIDYNISGGTELYELQWDNGTDSGTVSNLTEGNHNLTMLEAGSYNITVTDDYGCTTDGTFSLIEPPVLQLTATDSSDVSCYNGSDGSITVNITGGTANYDLSWDNVFGTPGSMNNIPAGSHVIPDLTSGTWTISLVDDHGCTTSTVVTIDEPATELVISIVSITDASCVGVDDGSAEVEVTGGVPPYDYTWDHPNGNDSIIENVTAGDYNLTVTDDWGCEDTITVTIGQPPSGLYIDPDITPVTCPGNSDGEIILNASGGTPSYTYTWAPSVSTGDVASNLTTGDYDVTINDQGTCELQTTIFVPVDPNTLTASITDTTHIACNGDSTGEITVTATNGLFPYTYQWVGYPGETSNTISDVPAGDFEVIVTDAHNCEVHVFQTLNEPPPLGFTVDSITDVVCAGDATGSIYTTPQGGTPSYYYTWEDASNNNQGVSGDDLINVVSGTYYFSVTDINGCGPATGSATIDEPANPLTVNITIDNLPSCPGDNDGSITANPSGGTPAYTDFIWGPPIAGETSQSPSNLTAGTYCVTVTDSEGCTAENCIVLNDPDSIQIEILAYDVLCNGDCNGYAVAIVTGGTPNYTYHWEDGLGNLVSSDDTALNLCAENYYLTVTDSHGCVAVASTTIGEAFVLTGSITSTDVSTWGNNDGSATANPSGGTPSYSYEWEDDSNPGTIISTNQTISNLYAGTYNLTITDDNGCIWSGSVTIIEPNDPLFGDIITHQDVLCAPDSSGSLTAQGYGATPPYTYDWENSSGTPVGTDQTVEDLLAGTYYLTIYDANNYSWDTTVTITQPPLLQITGYSSTNISCYGDSTGSACITAAGGVPYPGIYSYIYQWDDPDNSTTDCMSNAPAGTYTASVTDQNGCHADTSITITQAPEIIIDLTVTATPDCYGENGGSAASSVSSGTPPYTYIWRNESGIIVSLTDTLIDKPAGWYYLYVNDNIPCEQVDSIYISEPELLITTSGGNDATGYGVSDGIVWTSPDGGTEPYSYEWEDADNPGTIISTNDTVYYLPAGTYPVTITDANGCQVIDAVTINEPDELVYTIDGEDAQCYGESTGGAWIHVNGGVTPYEFYWTDDDDNYISDDSVMVMIPAGWYHITVTDDNGYQIIDSVEIGQPPAIDVTVVSINHVDCYGESSGSINTNVSGGSPGYTYEWIETSNPSVVIGTNDNISGLTAGHYQFTVEDDSTCTFDTTFTITEPDLFEATVSSQGNITCYGDDDGYIAVDVTGGTNPYTLTWLDNSMAIYATGINSIADLSPGDYYFYAIDDHGCATDTLSFTITEPLPFVFDATIDSVFCYGASTGSIQLNPSGGTPVYSYQWYYEGTPLSIDYHILTNAEAGNYDVQVTDDAGCTYDTSLIVPQPSDSITLDFTLIDSIDCYGNNIGSGLLQINGGTPQYDILYHHPVSGAQQLLNVSPGSHMLNNLLGGNYDVTVTDYYDCTEYLTFNIPYPPELTLDLSSQDILCAGDHNGEIEAIVNGGTPPYTYTWDSGVPGSDSIADNLGPGWHYLTVNDDQDCTIEDSVNIYEPDSLLISLIDSVYLDCYGDENGSALASISGGTMSFNIVWTNSAGDTIQYGPFLNNLGGGTYSLDVTDANGCTAHDSLIVHEPTQLSGTMESFPTTCPGSSDGWAVINMDYGSGTPPYGFDWNNPEHSVTDTAYNLSGGWWTVTVIDDHGCPYVDSVEVISPDPLVMTFDITPVQCNNIPGSVTVHTTGGTPNYDYLWSTGHTTGTVNDMPAGVHTVTVTDSEGCTASQQIMVGSEGSIHPYITITSPVSCYGANDGSLTAMVDDGQLPYSFDWNIPETTQTITDLPAGIYAVEVTDDWGCTGTDTITLNQPNSITLDFQVQDALCKGEASGEALAIAQGGNGSFTYNWDGGEFYGNPYTNLSAGYYQVVASDQNGCTGEGQVYVSEPDSMLYGIANTRNVTCYGYNNGRAIAQGYGGTPPYEYQWTGVGSDTIHQQQTNASLFPGNYRLQITDQHGCTYDTIVMIYQPSPIYVSVSGYGGPTCHGNDDGWIQLDTIIGGTPPYTLFINGAGLSWTQNYTSIDSIPAGEYQITIYDANDCPQNSDAILISLAESDEDCIKVPAAFSPNGDGFNDTWQIDHLELYRSVLIQIYNRWGQMLYEAGWNDDFWDGTYNGKPVPTGAYVYFIDFGDNKTKPQTGTVTVIR
ncbi:MAG: gliding motility-associated C-terminal domain-containing protein [Bacteroidota bacterium]|nr:gliding motility-associated C-terminal domain-containing protein [Bacteroidota bacterium]